MKNLFQEFLLSIAIYGEAVGIVLIGVVVLRDFLMTGARGFLEYAIGPAGVVLIIIGLGLILASKHIDRKYK